MLSAPPVAGRPPNLEFYNELLDAYDVLIRSGSRSPVWELAHAFRVPTGTVKSWLSRGRRFTGRSSLKVPPRRHCATCTCPEASGA